jgi:hypothetical protein
MEKNHIYYRPFPIFKNNKKVHNCDKSFFKFGINKKKSTNDNEFYLTLEKQFGLF